MNKLNNTLLIKQKVSKEDELKLIEVHKAISKVKDISSILNENNLLDEPSAKLLLNLTNELDSKLQKLWRFKHNPDYFKHHYGLSGCTCPKLDNYDRLGTPYRIVSCNCPYHHNNTKD